MIYFDNSATTVRRRTIRNWLQELACNQVCRARILEASHETDLKMLSFLRLEEPKSAASVKEARQRIVLFSDIEHPAVKESP